jgi:hypothetical protein
VYGLPIAIAHPEAFNIMTTVQLAIHNQRYADTLASLLQDGSRLVEIVDKPDLRVEGIIVMDGNRPENLLLFEAQPERFVVIASKDTDLLSRIWDAGVRHVVFEADSPATALLAVIAAELRTPRLRENTTLPALVEEGRRRLLPKFPMQVLDPPAPARRFFTNIRKTPF